MEKNLDQAENVNVLCSTLVSLYHENLCLFNVEY